MTFKATYNNGKCDIVITNTTARKFNLVFRDRRTEKNLKYIKTINAKSAKSTKPVVVSFKDSLIDMLAVYVQEVGSKATTIYDIGTWTSKETGFGVLSVNSIGKVPVD